MREAQVELGPSSDSDTEASCSTNNLTSRPTTSTTTRTGCGSSVQFQAPTLIGPTPSNEADIPNSIPEAPATDFSRDYYSSSSSEETDVRYGLPNSDLASVDFTDFFKKWAKKYEIKHDALRDLLPGLRVDHPELPRDPRTLLETKNSHPIQSIAGGSYCHFGLAASLNSELQRNRAFQGLENLALQVNIDGLPLFKSAPDQFWPILGKISQADATPFVIGLFHGTSKPSCPSEFLSDFVKEVKELLEEGLVFEGKRYKVEISAFVCDAPARSYLKQIKSHNGYHGCERCIQDGEWFHDERRLAYPEFQAELRSDASFQGMIDEDHHVGESALAALPVGLVSKFPLEYMHLVCLGVVRRLLSLWLDANGSKKVRLPHRVRSAISDHLVSLQRNIPKEFARKPRSLVEKNRWKATELRLFLLYTGPFVLDHQLDLEVYQNFMLLSCAIRILADPLLSQDFCEFARSLLENFVKHYARLYGEDQLVYNVHNLIHLPDDCALHGPLDAFSAFPFENFLGQLKKCLRKKHQVMAQVVRRLSEQTAIAQATKEPTYEPIVSMKHHCGPLPRNLALQVAGQFRCLKLKSFVVRVNTADCCVKIGGRISIVKNIFECVDHGLFVVYKAFTKLGDFFSYPMPSHVLDIHKLDELGEELLVATIFEIEKKYVLLPAEDDFVAFPILHSSDVV